MIKIREKRESLGITQVELAKKVGITQQHLCDIEQGRSKPSLNVAVRIAKALNEKSIKFFE